jgi:hypothetical protein
MQERKVRSQTEKRQRECIAPRSLWTLLRPVKGNRHGAFSAAPAGFGAGGAMDLPTNWRFDAGANTKHRQTFLSGAGS